MDNNTAPNNGFTYPDFAPNSGVNNTVNSNNTPITSVNPQPSTVPQPVVQNIQPSSEDDLKILEDLANQLKQLQSEDSKTPPPPPIKPIVEEKKENSLPNIDKPVDLSAPVSMPTPTTQEPVTVPQFELPDQPSPILPNVVTEDTIGVVKDDLEDIMPGDRLPKALQRTPKENNLAQPMSKPVDNSNDTLKSNVNVNNVVKDNKGVSFEDIKSDTNTFVNTPTKNSIDDLLKYAIERNASDLHISVGYPPVVRIDGHLQEVNDQIISPKDAEDLIFPILPDEKKELLEVNREIDLAYFHEGDNSARFRVNAYYTMKNLAAAFRLIPSRVRTLDELMLPPIYTQFANLKQGLILVTGPTGHGKSTTLAAILEQINRTRFVHIVTIEDPIEYVFEGKKALIDQREMNDDTHSWPVALRSALRQDPDVILVGEMRDYETIASAITLAETGHLVFATLHTNNCSQTVDRIIDVFPENQQPQIRSQLSNILEAVVAQRLIPLEKGGRRAVSEIMINNPAIQNLIREGKTHQIDNVIRTSADMGMISLEKSLVSLVREGAISIQRAQEYAIYPEEVLRLLKS